MWDEQERFAKGVSKLSMWVLVVFGVVLAAISLATGMPQFFFAFLLLLAALVGVSQLYGFVALSVGGLLLAITRGVTYGFTGFGITAATARIPDRGEIH
jgi:hypothetical protein